MEDTTPADDDFAGITSETSPTLMGEGEDEAGGVSHREVAVTRPK